MILALTATLLMFSRLDTVFLAGLFGLWIVFRDRPLHYLLPLDALLLTFNVTSAFLLRIGLPAYYLYTNTAILTLAVSLALKVPAFFLPGSVPTPQIAVGGLSFAASRPRHRHVDDPVAS
jgi:hypothetical protein